MNTKVIRSILIAGVAACSLAAPARLPIHDGQVVPLWTGAAPGALGTDTTDIPAVTVFLPRNMTANTPSIIVAPGGGYVALASIHEGAQVAKYLNSLGVAAFVLRYRLGPKYHHPIELGDAQRAIQLLRSKATDWHLDPTRIGIMGFSAGGHLAMSASTHFAIVDGVSSRPDFAILAYPTISMTESWTHTRSRTALLGANPDPQVAASLSGEKVATKDTPPTFIFQTTDDAAVAAENSVYYYLALRKAGVPVEMHLFEHGAHGVGLARGDRALAEWTKLLTNWLRGRGIVK